MKILPSFFTPSVAFQPVDPLADGLGDDIALEQQEAEAIQLDADDTLFIEQFWQNVDRDLHAGSGLSFSDDAERATMD